MNRKSLLRFFVVLILALANTIRMEMRTVRSIREYEIESCIENLLISMLLVSEEFIKKKIKYVINMRKINHQLEIRDMNIIRRRGIVNFSIFLDLVD